MSCAIRSAIGGVGHTGVYAAWVSSVLGWDAAASDDSLIGPVDCAFDGALSAEVIASDAGTAWCVSIHYWAIGAAYSVVKKVAGELAE